MRFRPDRYIELGVMRSSAVFLFAISVSFSIVTGCMQPSTYEYFLNHDNKQEREALIARLENEFFQWVTTDDNDSTKTAAFDPDRFWPLERLALVIGIERFILSHGTLPQNLDDVEEYQPALQEKSFDASPYRLISDEKTGTWKLYKQDTFLVAMGN